MFANGFLSWRIKYWGDWQQFYLILIQYIVLFLILWIVERKGSGYFNSYYYATKININFFNNKLISIWIGKSNKYVPYIFSLLLIFPAFLLPPTTGALSLLALAISLFVILFYPWWGKTKENRLGNSLIFVVIFSLLLLYLFTPGFPDWIPVYLLFLSAITFIWVVFRVVFKRRYQVILPTSFELLLICVSWFIPLVWSQIVNFEIDIKQQLFLTCALSVPILAGSKAMLRRHSRRNKKFVILLVGALLYIGIKSLWIMT